MKRIALELAGAACDPLKMPRELAEAVQSGDDKAIRVSQARALMQAVQKRIRYFEDAPLAKPFEAWSSGIGDCKSASVLLCALALSIGCEANLVALGWDEKPQHSVCVLRPVPELGWLWAETTMAAELGEHPSHALLRCDGGSAMMRVRPDLSPKQLGELFCRLRKNHCIRFDEFFVRPSATGLPDPQFFAPATRLRGVVTRQRLTSEVHAYAAHVLVQAFQRVLGREPKLFERQLVQAVAMCETQYGRGWSPPCDNSRNWGGVQLTKDQEKAGVPGCAYTDSFPDGTRYTQAFRVYATDVDAAADVVRLLYVNMKAAGAALTAGKSISDVSRAMFYSHYYGASCPSALAKYGAAAKQSFGFYGQPRATTEAGKACEAECIAQHVKAISACAFEIADALKEPRPPVGSSSSSPASSTKKKVLAGVALAGIVGGGAYTLRRLGHI